MRAFASTRALFCYANSEHFRNYKLQAGQQAVSYWEWLNRDKALSCCLALRMLSRFVKPCLQASRFPLKRVKDSPPLQAKCFRYRITLLPETELRAISFNKRQQNEEGAFPETFMARACSPMFPSFPYGKHCSQCQFLFSRYKLCLRLYATRQGILRKIRACELLHKQASTHLIFASNSSKGQILRALSNWIGPFDTPIRLSVPRFGSGVF